MNRTISAAIAALTTVVLVPSGAAHAESQRLDDGKGDVFRVTEGDDGQDVYVAAPKRRTNVDIDTVVVSHGQERIRVKGTFFDLAKETTFPYVGAEIETDTGAGYVLYATAYKSAEGWVARASFSSTSQQPETRGGVQQCEGVDVDIDWKADTLAASVPRSCLLDPAWVRVHSDVHGDEETGASVRHFYDNPHNAGGDPDKGRTGRLTSG